MAKEKEDKPIRYMTPVHFVSWLSGFVSGINNANKLYQKEGITASQWDIVITTLELVRDINSNDVARVFR